MSFAKISLILTSTAHPPFIFFEEWVILMGQKVKEEVEHQLKSEFEKSVQEHSYAYVDRMKTTEDRMDNK